MGNCIHYQLSSKDGTVDRSYLNGVKLKWQCLQRMGDTRRSSRSRLSRCCLRISQEVSKTTRLVAKLFVLSLILTRYIRHVSHGLQRNYIKLFSLSQEFRELQSWNFFLLHHNTIAFAFIR